MKIKGLEVNDLDMLIQALTFYTEKNIDFADGLLAAHALNQDLEAA